MNDQLIRDLLHEVADDVEPGDRLDAIRSATAPAGRRTHRGWWAAGGAGLLAASIATAFALTTGGMPQSGDSDVANPSPTTTAPTTGPTDSPPRSNVVAVYFVGDTSQGPRLYREFRSRKDPSNPALYALRAAVAGTALDRDYGTTWPAGVSVHDLVRTSEGILFSLSGAPTDRPADMSEEDARLAVEQLVRTAQAVYGMGKLPVRVLVDGQEADRVLGVSVADPLTGSPDADVLAPVNLSDPSEGQVVHKDDFIDMTGRATSVDGMISLQLKRWQGTAVIDAGTYTLYGTGEFPDAESVQGVLAPFSAQFRSHDVQPGAYDVIATVQNADGTYDYDTRRITIVD
jgi:hypothetical protein